MSYEPWELRDGEAPTNTSPLIVEDGDPDVTPPRPVTLEEYGILLEGLVSGGKLSREDALELVSREMDQRLGDRKLTLLYGQGGWGGQCGWGRCRSPARCPCPPPPSPRRGRPRPSG